MSYIRPPNGVVPKLVSDVNLKRARVETDEGDAIRVIGTGCGDKVTIVPTLDEGTKIADYTINNVDGALYAPPPTEVSITPSVTTGTKIADFSIDNVEGELYVPPGGVGQAYSGSTGGEIFNYYVDDTSKNEASGNYSTAHGQKNQALGVRSFVAGYGNEIRGGNSIGIGNSNVMSEGVRGNDTFMIGYQNSVRSTATYCTNNTLMGSGNSIKSSANDSQGNVLLGSGNSLESHHYKSTLCGCDLYAGSNFPITCQFYGISNNTTASLTSPLVVIGCGDPDNHYRKTAIEINKDTTKICIPLQLASDTTEVNAITPPQDPNNVTADDKTLVTKSHLATNLDNYAKSQVAYIEDWDTAPALPLDNNTVSLPTTYGAIPTWAKRAILTFRWENELITKEIFFDKDEGIHLYVVQRAYSTFPDTIHYRHLRIEWDFTNQTLVVKDYWTYDQDMANAGALSNWGYTLTNASPCKILSVIYSE